MHDAAKVTNISAGKKARAIANEFLVPMSDQHGHAVRVEFRVHPDHKRAIGEMLTQHPETGWKTESDFGRYAVRLALEHLAQLFKDGEISNTLKKVRLIENVVASKELNLRVSKIIDEMAKTADEMRSDGDSDGAGLMVADALELIEQMDDEQHKKVWRERIERRFAHLL